jgi:Cu+-exporting ATPase
MEIANNTSTHVFQVEGMHCGSCALLIDDVVQDLPGVHDTQTSVTQHRTTVELDISRGSADDVITAITELGYRAAMLR